MPELPTLSRAQMRRLEPFFPVGAGGDPGWRRPERGGTGRRRRAADHSRLGAAIQRGWSGRAPDRQHAQDPVAAEIFKKLPAFVAEIAARHPGQPMEIWFQDEAWIGQK
jgi:hypothetical protein